MGEKWLVNYLETKKERERNSDQNTNSDQESLSVNNGGVNPREEQNGVGWNGEVMELGRNFRNR